jgi:alkane 1-monooxygenase
VAYFPPLWFRLMDRRVVAHHGGDLSGAHLHPPRREALLTRWSQRPDAAPAATATDGPRAATSEAADARYQCPNCAYIYDPAAGCPHEGYPAGTAGPAWPTTGPARNARCVRSRTS